MSTEAEGAAALADAERIIEDLGIGDMSGLPENPADLVARLEGASGEQAKDEGKEADTPQDDTAKGATPDATADSSAAATPKEGDDAGASNGKAGEAAPGEQQPAGVLLKDGKHFLPYDKHVEERRQRMAAEERNRQLEAELATLKAGGARPGTEGNPQASTGSFEGDLALVDDLEAKAQAYEDEGLTELAGTTRASAKLMRAMANQLQELGGYVQQAREREAQEQTRAQQSVREQIAEAIENNPKLRFLNDTAGNNPESAEIWDEVAATDEVLRALPKYQGMSFADRFAEAVKRVEAGRGPIKLPPEYQSVADVKAAAQAKADQAGEFRPSTLSDLPGGGVPRGADNDPMSNLDPVQLERIMMDASPDKIAEMLARV